VEANLAKISHKMKLMEAEDLNLKPQSKNREEK
jgi:hypothetical protein